MLGPVISHGQNLQHQLLLHVSITNQKLLNAFLNVKMKQRERLKDYLRHLKMINEWKKKKKELRNPKSEGYIGTCGVFKRGDM